VIPHHVEPCVLRLLDGFGELNLRKSILYEQNSIERSKRKLAANEK